ncbi:TPA: hypothetical protein ACTXXA_002084 [Legionella anisa]
MLPSGGQDHFHPLSSLTQYNPQIVGGQKCQCHPQTYKIAIVPSKLPAQSLHIQHFLIDRVVALNVEQHRY